MKYLSKSSRGFGVVEVLIAAALIIVLVYFVAGSISDSQKTSIKIRNSVPCQNFASSALQSIKNEDNALNVRSWIPSLNQPRAPASAQDPFCKSVTGVCDEVDFYTADSDRKLATGPNTHQNIRSATSWAQSLYLKHQPTICTDTGLTVFDRNSRTSGLYQEIWPSPPAIELPVQKIELFVKAKDFDCGPLPFLQAPGRSGGFEVKVYVTYLNAGATEADLCLQEATVDFQLERAAPAMSQFHFVNSAGDIIPAGSTPQDQRCSCRRGWDRTNPNMVPTHACDEMFDVSLLLNSSEPGTFFQCNQSAPAGSTGLRSCSDVRAPLQGGDFLYPLGTLRDPNTNAPIAVDFNRPIAAQFRFNSTNLTQNVYVGLTPMAVDTSSNTASGSEIGFIVKKPFCPDPTTYCANEPPPQDGCGRQCPEVGSRPLACAPQGSVCSFEAIYDSNCGEFCYMGNKPQNTGCPVFYNCSQPPPYDDCGRVCTNGLAPRTCAQMKAGVCYNEYAGYTECGENCGMGAVASDCATRRASTCYNRPVGPDNCGVDCGGNGDYDPGCTDLSTDPAYKTCGTELNDCGDVCTRWVLTSYTGACPVAVTTTTMINTTTTTLGTACPTCPDRTSLCPGPVTGLPPGCSCPDYTGPPPPDTSNWCAPGRLGAQSVTICGVPYHGTKDDVGRRKPFVQFGCSAVDSIPESCWDASLVRWSQQISVPPQGWCCNSAPEVTITTEPGTTFNYLPPGCTEDCEIGSVGYAGAGYWECP